MLIYQLIQGGNDRLIIFRFMLIVMGTTGYSYQLTRLAFTQLLILYEKINSLPFNLRR